MLGANYDGGWINKDNCFYVQIASVSNEHIELHFELRGGKIIPSIWVDGKCTLFNDFEDFIKCAMDGKYKDKYLTDFILKNAKSF